MMHPVLTDHFGYGIKNRLKGDREEIRPVIKCLQ